MCRKIFFRIALCNWNCQNSRNQFWCFFDDVADGIVRNGCDHMRNWCSFWAKTSESQDRITIWIEQQKTAQTKCLSLKYGPCKIKDLWEESGQCSGWLIFLKQKIGTSKTCSDDWQGPKGLENTARGFGGRVKFLFPLKTSASLSLVWELYKFFFLRLMLYWCYVKISSNLIPNCKKTTHLTLF